MNKTLTEKDYHDIPAILIETTALLAGLTLIFALGVTYL